jgi:hypothetical protein
MGVLNEYSEMLSTRIVCFCPALWLSSLKASTGPTVDKTPEHTDDVNSTLGGRRVKIISFSVCRINCFWNLSQLFFTLIVMFDDFYLQNE